MDIQTFKDRQEALGLTNAALAERFKKSEQSISNYRNGVQKIPAHVEVLFEQIEQS